MRRVAVDVHILGLVVEYRSVLLFGHGEVLVGEGQETADRVGYDIEVDVVDFAEPVEENFRIGEWLSPGRVEREV